jgi:hypothetical protein
MSKKVKVDGIAGKMQDILNEVASETEKSVKDAGDKVAKDAVKKLKKASPSGKGTWNGHYKSGWTVKQDKDGNYTIYNKKKYQLTHLLEKGHNIVRNGKVVGYVKGKPHISTVEEWVQKEYPKQLTNKLNKGL